MSSGPKPITLTTDFGLIDGYAGILKGVILGIAPACRIIDLSHEIKPFDRASAAWLIANSYRYFPAGTIHLVVVDPGVGSLRRSILLKGAEGSFVGPDNGTFSRLLKLIENPTAYELTEAEYWLEDVSNSFHARDIFAPVAAHLAAGVKPLQLARQIDIASLVQLPEPRIIITEDTIEGEIVYVDRFGNLVTNIPADKIQQNASISVAGTQCGTLAESYSGGKDGEPVALLASHGFLEIGINQGSALRFFGGGVGKPVVARFRPGR
jgi:S-adenosylmethionine hydrolase